jgi:hypothetical protein
MAALAGEVLPAQCACPVRLPSVPAKFAVGVCRWSLPVIETLPGVRAALMQRGASDR